MLSIVVPVLRVNFFSEVLFPSLCLVDPPPGRLIVVSNEIHPETWWAEIGRSLRPRFRVEMYGFSSKYYPFGPKDVSLRRNVGLWATHPHDEVVFIDDDEFFPSTFASDCSQALAEAEARVEGPSCVWGNYRYVEGDGSNYAELSVAPPSAGESRENPPNFMHQFESGYAGLVIARSLFVRMHGGWDMAFCGRHNQEDQYFALKMAQSVTRSTRIFVSEPPFVWHPKVRIPYHPPAKSNVCESHNFLFQDKEAEREWKFQSWAGRRYKKCLRCPAYQFRLDDLQTSEILMPYDPTLVELRHWQGPSPV